MQVSIRADIRPTHQFFNLHASLGDAEALPPKRILVTSFIPSAWADDKLIAERKDGLSTYLTKLLSNPTYATNPVLLDFLGSSAPPAAFSLEDALPSTLSRKTALTAMLKATSTTPVAAAYYPDWATGTIAPQDIDFSKFDILLFGTSSRPVSVDTSRDTEHLHCHSVCDAKLVQWS